MTQLAKSKSGRPRFRSCGHAPGDAVKLTVSVTADHINQGKSGNGEFCPIALAVRELVAEGSYVIVDQGSMYVRRPDEGFGFEGDTPGSAIDFINAFDSHRPVEPFTFEVELS